MSGKPMKEQLVAGERSLIWEQMVRHLECLENTVLWQLNPEDALTGTLFNAGIPKA